jgi:hypothetical protein
LNFLKTLNTFSTPLVACHEQVKIATCNAITFLNMSSIEPNVSVTHVFEVAADFESAVQLSTSSWARLIASVDEIFSSQIRSFASEPKSLQKVVSGGGGVNDCTG